MDNSVHKSISETTENVPNDSFRCGYFKDEEEFGAGNETRTRDPDLGKVVLYQLSYSRLGGSDAVCILRYFQILERETRLELATPTLARSCSTN